MSEIKRIEGEIFRDHRGTIASLNNFRFDGIERTYIIHHPDKNIIRGWHAHQFERKWFYCIKGSFTIALVEIDNWENPDPELPAEIFHISEEKSEIICVPAGYANCVKANEDGSILQVYSDKILTEAVKDSWRYDSNMWVDWSNY